MAAVATAATVDCDETDVLSAIDAVDVLVVVTDKEDDVKEDDLVDPCSPLDAKMF